MKRPRGYQQEAFNAIFDSYNSGRKKVLIEMATGLGKTVVAAMAGSRWMEEERGPILFTMHMMDPLDQARREFDSALEGLGVCTGILHSGLNETFDADVFFSTFQSVDAVRREIPPDDFTLLIVDEAHHGHAESYKRTIEYFKPDLLVGLTATPGRMDGQDIREIFGEPVYRYTLADALADGRWLSSVDYRLLVDNVAADTIRIIKRRIYQGDGMVNMRKVDNKIFLHEDLGSISEMIKAEQRIGNKKTIIFCRSIDQINQMARFIPEAVGYHSGVSQRRLGQILNDFRKGEIRTILVRDKFNEAMDIPDAELVVFLRSTDSRTIWLQQLGRGLRKVDGKERVVVMDFVARCSRAVNVFQLGEEIRRLWMEANPGAEGVPPGWSLSVASEMMEIIDLVHHLRQRFYPTWSEAAKAARALGIRNPGEYKRHFQEDKRLPGVPSTLYPEEWTARGGWAGFLDRPLLRVILSGKPAPGVGVYPRWEQSASSAKRFKIRTPEEYKRWHSLDPRLPPDPEATYGAEVWERIGGWEGFLYWYQERKDA